MAGRGVEHEQQFGTGSMRQFGRTGFPDVGADIDAAAHTAKRHDAGFGARIEIALLVKNFVIREANLAVNRRFLAIFDDRSRVVASGLHALRITDNQGNTRQPGSPVVQRPLQAR
jgi:hypothetical protein